MMRSRLSPFILAAVCPFIWWFTPCATAETATITTNQWLMPADRAIEHVSMIMGTAIEMEGQTYDDSFWLAKEHIHLNGLFGNDVWALAPVVQFNGVFADHARALAQSVHVTGTISNGLWAAGKSVTVATNAILYGEQFIFCDNLTMLGQVEGSILARARQITIGGTIVGDVTLYGDDIVVRPGTTIVGNFLYISTNRTIVLDANSHVSGVMKHRNPVTVTGPQISPAWNAMLQLYLFGASLLVGIPYMLLFPGVTGLSVRTLRLSLWKCGLSGIILLFGSPLIIVGSAVTVIGIPFAVVFGAAYGLILYLGKYTIALMIGSALLNRRGNISIPMATLSLVTGLFLYYSLGMIPIMGSSLQTTASAFGAGSLLLAILAGRGKIRSDDVSQR